VAAEAEVAVAVAGVVAVVEVAEVAGVVAVVEVAAGLRT